MRSIILTGASSGLWKSIAALFHAQGFQVIGLSRSKPEDFVIWIPTDLTQESDVLAAVERIEEEYSQFSLLVNCAGDGSGEDIDHLAWHDVEETFRLNAIAPIILTSKLLPLIRKNEADIVNIGATIGFKPYEYFSVYGASKWWFRGWTENLQLELKKTKCRVLGIHPGGMETKWNDKRMDQIAELSGKQKASQNFMSSEEIAKIVFYIAGLPKNIEISEMIINRK